VPEVVHRPSWESVPASSVPADAIQVSGDVLTPLWARSAALAALTAGKTTDAQRLGFLYRVITPATGAVVLETDIEYEQNGLDETPSVADFDAAPSVPEPGTAALFALGLAAVIARRRSSRARCAA
jgi:hypothetical protein